MKKKPLINNDGEVRDLTSKDFKKMRLASEVLPKELLSVLPKRNLKIIKSDFNEKFWKKNMLKMPKTKNQISLRLDSDILEWFKSQGSGYQTRMNAVLRTYMEATKRF